MGAVNVHGTDDQCCGVFFLKWVLYIFNSILLVRLVCHLHLKFAVSLDVANFRIDYI